MSAYGCSRIELGVVAYVRGVVRNGGPRKDAVLINQAVAFALGCRVRAAFDVTVKAGDDVAVGRALEVLSLLLQYGLLLRDLAGNAL